MAKTYNFSIVTVWIYNYSCHLSKENDFLYTKNRMLTHLLHNLFKCLPQNYGQFRLCKQNQYAASDRNICRNIFAFWRCPRNFLYLCTCSCNFPVKYNTLVNCLPIN